MKSHLTPFQEYKLSLRILIISSFLVVMPVFAGDLDDGIAIDEPLDDTLTTDMNRTFIVNMVNAKKKAGSSGKNGKVITSDGVGNINIGVGTDLKGATIINLSDNEGATAVSD